MRIWGAHLSSSFRDCLRCRKQKPCCCGGDKRKMEGNGAMSFRLAKGGRSGTEGQGGDSGQEGTVRFRRLNISKAEKFPKSPKEVLMKVSKRKSEILKLLEENRYLSVKRLAQLTYTSESSIRRDLADLQNQRLLIRTHGGAKPMQSSLAVPPLVNRMTQNIIGKQTIAKKAARLLCDRQIVMLDGSSTAGFLIPHIAKHKNIRLYTNNMLTALSATENGITTVCIGGTSADHSAVLTGTFACQNVASITPDILFFSSQSLDDEGTVSDSSEAENYLRSLMISAARESVFLCDHEKFHRRSPYRLTDIHSIDHAIFDEPYEREES